MLLIITLDVDSIPGDITVEDLVDLAALYSANRKYDDVYMVVQMPNEAASKTISTIHSRLDITEDRIYRSSGSSEVLPSANIIAGTILYLCDTHSAVSIYNSNNDTAIDIDIANINKPAAEIYQLFKNIDTTYFRKDIYTLSSLIDLFMLAMRRNECELAANVRTMLKPLSVFLGVYLKLVHRLSSDNMEWGRHLGDHSLFKSIYPVTTVERLIANKMALDEKFQNIEFVKETIEFFKAGERYFGNAVHGRNYKQRQRATISALAWLSAYSNIAAREALNAYNYRIAFLHIFRCLEYYFLSNLWSSRDAVFESGSIKLENVRHPYDINLQKLWDTYKKRRDLTPETIASFEALDKNLRQHRNRHLLIHGFSDPDEGITRKARHLVNEAILQHERERNRFPGSKIIAGSLAVCFENKKWNDSPGRTIARGVLEFVK